MQVHKIAQMEKTSDAVVVALVARFGEIDIGRRPAIFEAPDALRPSAVRRLSIRRRMSARCMDNPKIRSHGSAAIFAQIDQIIRPNVEALGLEQLGHCADERRLGNALGVRLPLEHPGRVKTTGLIDPRGGLYARSLVLCVKFCKRRSFGLGLCRLADLGFLVFLEIVHVEVTVGLEPVLVGLDG